MNVAENCRNLYLRTKDFVESYLKNITKQQNRDATLGFPFD